MKSKWVNRSLLVVLLYWVHNYRKESREYHETMKRLYGKER